VTSHADINVHSLRTTHSINIASHKTCHFSFSDNLNKDHPVIINSPVTIIFGIIIIIIITKEKD